MSGATIVGSGQTSDQGQASDLVIMQAADVGVVSHVGTPIAGFVLAYNGATINFLAGIPFIADAGLFAAINASAAAVASVAWTN